jgi:CubicO group peptidase (beta-lactamase class C family)
VHRCTVAEYLRRVRVAAASQLLTSTSGLPQRYAADRIADRDEAVRAVLGDELAAPPGLRFNYSNDGYSLLAAIVEVASGTAFETYLRRELLAPTGLTSTGFWGDVRQTGVPLAPTNRWVDVRPNWGFRGATGMYSTVGDLNRWTQALLAYQVLTRAGTDALGEVDGEPARATRTFKNPLNSTTGLVGHGVGIEAVVYHGRSAVRVVKSASGARLRDGACSWQRVRERGD